MRKQRIEGQDGGKGRQERRGRGGREEGDGGCWMQCLIVAWESPQLVFITCC